MIYNSVIFKLYSERKGHHVIQLLKCEIMIFQSVLTLKEIEYIKRKKKTAAVSLYTYNSVYYDA